MRLKILFIFVCCLGNFAFANHCNELNSDSIWNQLVVRGERYTLVWPQYKTEKKARVGAISVIAPFIQTIIVKKIFDQFGLKDGEAYTFPIQNTIRNRDKKIILSIQLKRIKKSQGVTVIELSNLKNVSADENFENLAALSLHSQRQLITVGQDIQMPAGLVDFLNITEASIRSLIIELFKNTDALDQINNMPSDTALTLERPEFLMSGQRTASARRLKFFKDQSGFVYLLAIEG